jgi:spermidine synthase
LGVGTIAIYGRETDTIRFYEINPEVERLARQHFTYLEDSEAAVEVVLGDARLTMENEPPQHYDVLVVDAFSSDAVPVHLLTAEAMEVYLKHLADDGVLAFHISTLHLDLHSVIWKLAEHFGLETSWIESFEDSTEGALASDWILLSRDGSFLNSSAIDEAESSPNRRRKEVMLWTDDHINVLEILKKNPLSQ